MTEDVWEVVPNDRPPGSFHVRRNGQDVHLAWDRESAERYASDPAFRAELAARSRYYHEKPKAGG